MSHRTRPAAFALALACLSPLRANAGAMTAVPATATSPAVPVYIARPVGPGPFPAVLLLHGCDGFNGFAAVAADRLTRLGYVAVALDSLGPQEPYAGCGDRDGSTDEAADARATLAWMRTLPYVSADRLAVIGFSMGASAVLNLVDPREPGAPAPAGLRAAVAFYPNCDRRDGNVAVPLRIFDGDADQITPAAPCAALAKAGAAAGKPVEITTYPGATHGFQIPGEHTFFGQPIRYDEAATKDSAQKVEQFLAASLK
jgi:dienelactone hydrolase